ncbi:MAG: GNAT family N-acetyltransferase [Bacilli bacterium]|nr:GNAT family N-acetyltransferase [Bacilli bacterium]
MQTKTVKKQDLKNINKMFEKEDYFISECDFDFANNIFMDVVIINDEYAAFIKYSIFYEQCELEYIFVKDNYRHFGIAKKLIEQMISHAIDRECLSITLEVNVNNQNAINLYNSYQFKTLTKRIGYYHGEDALLMERKLVQK